MGDEREMEEDIRRKMYIHNLVTNCFHYHHDMVMRCRIWENFLILSFKYFFGEKINVTRMTVVVVVVVGCCCCLERNECSTRWRGWCWWGKLTWWYHRTHFYLSLYIFFLKLVYLNSFLRAFFSSFISRIINVYKFNITRRVIFLPSPHSFTRPKPEE